jgi:transposase
VRALWEAGFPADVIAPSRTPRAPGRSGKGDRRDAADLAFLASRNMLKTIYVPTAQEEADRQMVRRRNQLVDELKRTKHRIKSFLLQHGQPGFEHWSKAAVERVRSLERCPELRWSLDSLLADYDHLRGQLDAADRQVEAMAETERHAALAKAVRRVPGVGLTTAMTVCTELPQAPGREMRRHRRAFPQVANTPPKRRPLRTCSRHGSRSARIDNLWKSPRASRLSQGQPPDEPRPSKEKCLCPNEGGPCHRAGRGPKTSNAGSELGAPREESVLHSDTSKDCGPQPPWTEHHNLVGPSNA